MNDVVIVKQRQYLCKFHLYTSILFYVIVCTLGLETSFELMILYGIISCSMMTLLLKSEVRFRGFSIVTLFVASSYLRLVLPTILDAIKAYNGESFNYFHDYTDALFPCAIAMNIYYMIFLLLLTKFSKKNKILSIDLSALLEKKHLLRVIILIFAWGVFYSIYSESIGIGFLGMFLDGFSQLALFMIAFVSAYKPEKKYLYTFYVLIVLEVVRTALWGFYKGAIMQPLFIYAIHYFFYCRHNDKPIITFKTVLLGGFLVVFLLGLVYPFMNAKRFASGWDPTNGVTKDIDLKELVVTVFENRDRLVDEDKGNSFLDRFDSLKPNAYFYKLVQIDGVNSIVLYASIRQFWPKWLGRESKDDVLLNPGYVVTSYMEYGKLRNLDFLSAGYIGSFSSGYFWGWWIGAFVVCVLNAYLMAWLLGYCTLYCSNYLSLLILISIVLGGISCYEEVHSGGLSRAIHWLMFLAVLKCYNIIHIKK